ncbi:MAG TPA: hypothetical protein VGN57_00220 [Pirellulaceae bacterium]|nr:hypothetical protein [Pirellulaceae bacterium]
MKTDLERQHVALSLRDRVKFANPSRRLQRVATLLAVAAALILSASVGTCSEPASRDHEVSGGRAGETRARRVAYHCGFEAETDVDYDLWPDAWTRVRDRRYPSYVSVRIQPEHGRQRIGDPAPAGNRVLRMELDGANASVTSPHVPVQRFQTYELSLRVRGASASDKIVTAALTFYDANRRSLGSQRSILYPQPGEDWRTLTLPDVEIEDSLTRYVRVHLTTDSLGRFAAGGSIDFDDVRLVEFPQVKLATDRTPALYSPGERPTLKCAVSADRPAIVWADFQLFDRQGTLVDEETVALTGEEPFGPAFPGEATSTTDGHASDAVGAAKADPAAPLDGSSGHGASEYGASEHDAAKAGGGHEEETHGDDEEEEATSAHAVLRSIATWTPELPGPGYYEAVVRCRGRDRDPSNRQPSAEGDVTFQRRVRFVALPKIEPARGGSFGWSFSAVRQPLAPRTLAQLAPELGVQWIRLPVWYDHEDQLAENEMADFLERLSEQGVQFIGALDRPPPRLCVGFATDEEIPIARAISDPALWQPALSPILPRMALKIQRWQLGSDDDLSLIGFPDRQRAIADVRAELIRYNRQVQIGVAWNWIYDLAPDVANELQFISFRADPPFAAHELDAYLEANTGRPFGTVVQIKLLDAGEYSDEARARDMLERMIQTRRHETLAALLPEPFSASRGIFTESGEPTPMLLPWRTAASQLGAARRIGQLSLRSEAVNHVFLRGNDALLVAWSDVPTQETLYLGDRPSAVDLWGNPVPLETVGEEHVVPIGPVPIFVSGLHPEIAAWRARFRLLQRDLESVPNKPQKLLWEGENAFAQGASGTLRVDAPELFTGGAMSPTFRLSPGETTHGDLTFTLGPQANGGMQTVRIDFDVSADRPYKFSTYEKVYVGLKDVRIDIRSGIDAMGALVVEQEFVNLGQTPVSFDFYLYAPDRKRKRLQLREVGPGTYKLEYLFPDGESLLGKELWLRAEASDGLRVLNHRFTPQRDDK